MHLYGPIKDQHGRRVAVLFADVPLESLSIMANNMYSGIDRVGILIMVLHVIGLIAVALIIWHATVTFRRWKESTVDPEKEALADKVAKLTEVNRRLTERNFKLAQKLKMEDESAQTGWYSSTST